MTRVKDVKPAKKKNVHNKETMEIMIDRDRFWNDPMCFPSFKA